MSRDWTEQIYGDMESTNIDEIIKEKEEQIERLQEQLDEANEVIKWYAQPDTGSAKDYLKKWGVK